MREIERLQRMVHIFGSVDQIVNALRNYRTSAEVTLAASQLGAASATLGAQHLRDVRLLAAVVLASRRGKDGELHHVPGCSSFSFRECDGGCGLDLALRVYERTGDAIRALRAYKDAAPVQPDARDAEIARLTRELAEAKFSPLGDNHHNAAKCPHCGDPLRVAQSEVARLTKELEEARAALRRGRNYLDLQNCYPDVLAQIDRAIRPERQAAPEPTAETPAETPITDLAQAMREALARRGRPAETAGRKEGP